MCSWGLEVIPPEKWMHLNEGSRSHAVPKATQNPKLIQQSAQFVSQIGKDCLLISYSFKEVVKQPFLYIANLGYNYASTFAESGRMCNKTKHNKNANIDFFFFQQLRNKPGKNQGMVHTSFSRMFYECSLHQITLIFRDYSSILHL